MIVFDSCMLINFFLNRRRWGRGLTLCYIWPDICYGVVVEVFDCQTDSCDDQACGHQGQPSVEQDISHQAALGNVAGSHGDIL